MIVRIGGTATALDLGHARRRRNARSPHGAVRRSPSSDWPKAFHICRMHIKKAWAQRRTYLFSSEEVRTGHHGPANCSKGHRIPKCRLDGSRSRVADLGRCHGSIATTLESNRECGTPCAHVCKLADHDPPPPGTQRRGNVTGLCPSHKRNNGPTPAMPASGEHRKEVHNGHFAIPPSICPYLTEEI